MKFLSPHQPNLQVHGAGRFTNGRLEVADADAASIGRIRAIAPHWGIQEVDSWPEQAVAAGEDVFDPRGVNLEGEGGVLEQLAAADDQERARIIALELESEKPRKTVLHWKPPADAAEPAAEAPQSDTAAVTAGA